MAKNFEKLIFGGLHEKHANSVRSNSHLALTQSRCDPWRTLQL
jgi:hypothetical protein